MTDGGLAVFTAAGREFCLMEMVREACGQFAEGRCTLDEFMDMYVAVVMAAAGVTKEELQARMRDGRPEGRP